MRKIASIVLCLALLVTSFSQTILIAFATGTPTITCENKECNPGDTVTVNVTIAENPGITYLALSPTYSAELGTPTVKNGSVVTDFTKGNQFLWVADEDVTENGKLVSFTFNIGETVEPNDYSVGFIFREAYNYDEDPVSFTVVPATISVKAKPVAVSGISLDHSTATVKTGNTVTLTPIFDPETATNKNVSWSTDNSSVATVEDGVVSGVKEGTATITVKTEDGNFEATCLVTVECGHNTTHVVQAEESTCIKQGHAAYTVCDECGRIVSGTDEKLPFGNHVYTESVKAEHLVSVATCNKKATYYKSCSVCGAASTETFESGEYDRNNHAGTTYKKDQKEATCYEEGYTGDTYCSDCDAKLSSGLVIEKKAHNPASTWSTDEDYHWHDCQTIGCGNLIDKAAHSGGEATCIHKAVCSVCKVEYGSLNSNNHKNTETRNAKAATCCEDGYTGDTYCKDCNTKIASGSVIPATGNHIDADGLWETDGNQHWHTCSYGTKFDITSHNGGTATCKDTAVCSVCGTPYGDVDTTNHVGETEIRNNVAATCCEDGYSGDTYCKDCNSKISSGTTISATGNHIDTNGLWETDGNQHWHTCYYGTKFDITSHSGGTATCKDQAVCSVCGTSYGEIDANNHTGTTYKKDQKEATCYEEGYTGDTYCSDCDAKISSGSVIQKNAHNPASVWSTDEDYHWHDCQTIGCGNLIDKAAHTGGEATCVNKAICSVCGVAYGTVDSGNHKNTEIRNVKAATCCENGYTGDTYCKDCGVKIADGTVINATGNHVDADGLWETDGTQHWHTCSYGTKFDITSHSGGTATCKDQAVCAICGVSYGELNSSNHVGGTEIRDAVIPSCNTNGYTGDTYCLGCGVKIAIGKEIMATGDHIDVDGKWETNGTQHWHTCSCGTAFDVTAHSGGTATCKDQAVCTICGTAYGDLDSHNHTGTTYKKGQKEATCYDEGYTGDTYCSDCNVKLSSGTVIQKNSHNPASTWSTDDDYHWHDCQTVGCGNLIDKAVHTGGEATCIHKAVCSVCNVEYGSLNANNHKNTEIRNAKTATCCESGYTGDTYCKDCGVKIADGTVINATGKHVDANNAWETDGTQHWHTCSYGTKFDITSHSGGTATCKDKAVCSVCGVAYGELNAENHVDGTEIRNAVAVSCDVDGYTGDIYCKGCGEKIAAGQSIPKITHTIKGWTVTKEATTSESGEKVGKCTYCGHEFKAEIAKLSSAPVAKENIEYEGMKTAPQLEPEGQTVLPSDIIFVAEKIDQEKLSDDQKADAAKAIEEVNNNLATIVGSGKKAENIDVVCVLDLSLLIHNYDAVSGADLGYEEYHFDGSVKVTVEVPEEMKSAKNPCLIHIKDDGTCEVVSFTDNGNGTISFTATGFSNYVLVDIETSNIQSNQNGKITSPQTGDDSNLGLWIILMVVSASGLVLTVISKKKNVR